MLTLTLIIAAVALVILVVQSFRRSATLRTMEMQQHISANPDVPPEIVRLAEGGMLIEALRRYREATGCSLDVARARIQAAVAQSKAGQAAAAPSYRIPGIN